MIYQSNNEIPSTTEIDERKLTLYFRWLLKTAKKSDITFVISIEYKISSSDLRSRLGDSSLYHSACEELGIFDGTQILGHVEIIKTLINHGLMESPEDIGLLAYELGILDMTAHCKIIESLMKFVIIDLCGFRCKLGQIFDPTEAIIKWINDVEFFIFENKNELYASFDHILEAKSSCLVKLFGFLYPDLIEQSGIVCGLDSMREICDEFFPDIPSFSTEDIFVSHHSLKLYFLLIYASIYKAFSERISPFLHNRAANSDGLLCNVNFDEIYYDNNFQEDSVNNSQFFTCRSSFPVDYSLDCSNDISSLIIKETLNVEATNEMGSIEESAVSRFHDQNDIKLENSKDFVQPQKRVSSNEEQEVPVTCQKIEINSNSTNSGEEDVFKPSLLSDCRLSRDTNDDRHVHFSTNEMETVINLESTCLKRSSNVSNLFDYCDLTQEDDSLEEINIKYEVEITDDGEVAPCKVEKIFEESDENVVGLNFVRENTQNSFSNDFQLTSEESVETFIPICSNIQDFEFKKEELNEKVLHKIDECHFEVVTEESKFPVKLKRTCWSRPSLPFQQLDNNLQQKTNSPDNVQKEDEFTIPQTGCAELELCGDSGKCGEMETEKIVENKQKNEQYFLDFESHPNWKEARLRRENNIKAGSRVSSRRINSAGNSYVNKMLSTRDLPVKVGAKPRTNKSRIVNAIKNVLLPGLVDRDLQKTVLMDVENCRDVQHFLVYLGGGRMKYKGIYSHKGQSGSKISGSGPNVVDDCIVSTFFKFDCASKKFIPLDGVKHFSIQVDGFSLLSPIAQTKALLHSRGFH